MIPPTTEPGQTTLNARRRVLLVDDDAAFLDMMDRVLSALSRGRWEVFTAESASAALGLLQEHPINLVLIDVQMPVVDGLQFLTLVNRRYPNLLKVVLTGFATESYRVACLSNGAELFLEKPKSPAQQSTLFKTLDELMRFQPEEGFRGVLRRAGLAEVIQMECLSAASSVLEITAARGQGRIYIRDGALVHAEAGDLDGEQALNHLLSLRGGEFRLGTFREPSRQTLDGAWEFLLMEAARARDEAQQPREVGDPSGSSAPPLETQTAPGAASPPGAAAEEPPPGQLRRTIREVLICSGAGTVLFEWQVRNSEVWVNFFEFLSQKARGVGHALGLGVFERLEAAAGDERLVALVGNDRGVLVRCREEDAA